VLRYGSSGSMTVDFNHIGYKVELDVMNISIFSGGGTYRTGLSIYTGSEANYLVKLRDSYIGHSEATAIFLLYHYPQKQILLSRYT